MNVNPESPRFTEVRPWDSLTEEERTSGDWILLPEVRSPDNPNAIVPPRAWYNPNARPRRLLNEIFAKHDPQQGALPSLLPRGEFDATGRPR